MANLFLEFLQKCNYFKSFCNLSPAIILHNYEASTYFDVKLLMSVTNRGTGRSTQKPKQNGFNSSVISKDQAIPSDSKENQTKSPQINIKQ